MNLRPAGLAGLCLLFGCLRFGYAQRTLDDSGVAAGMDAAVDRASAVRDGGTLQDAGQSSVMSSGDAAIASRDASAADTGKPLDAAAPQDASVPSDAALPQDASTPQDAATQGSADSGTVDAALSPEVICPATVTTNTYEGNGHFHGYLTLQNVGSTTWTQPTISFDLPTTVDFCDDVNKLPGTGWALQSMTGHCAYTRTGKALTIAPNAALMFEYSSTYEPSLAEPAVAHVTVTGCP